MTTAELESGTGKSSPGPGAWATHAALLLVQIAFASQAVEAKLAMLPRAQGGEGIFPEALAMTRMIGGAVFFWSVLAIDIRSLFRSDAIDAAAPGSRIHAPIASKSVRDMPALGARTHIQLAGLSVLGIALNQALFLLGLRWSSPFTVSLLGATIPVFTAALAALFRKERFVVRTGLGLILALAGVLSLTGVGSLSTQDRLGAILVALNSLSYAAYVVHSRDIVVRIGAMRLMAWIFTYGAIVFAPLGLRPMIAELPALSTRGWLLLAYVVAVPTILAYALNAWALGRSSATLVTIYIYLQPLLAGILARIQLGHTIAPRAIVAAVFILAGLGLVASRHASRRVA